MFFRKFSNRSGLWLNLIVAALLLIGLAVRLYGLTDPPLDFHPTRQLVNAIVARGMYYQMLPSADPQTRAAALGLMNAMERDEPRIQNFIVAVTYLIIGGEYVWVARIYSVLFWMAGGIVLFLLARRMVSARAAVVALGYYLLLPFTTLASRSFQVDPLMVMFIIFTAYAFHRWGEEQTWKRAIIAGLLAGLSILVKVTAAFPLIGMAVAVVLSRAGFRKAIQSPMIWAMTLLAALPGVLYYFVGIGERSSTYFSFWTLSLAGRLLDPSYYVRWLSFLHGIVDMTVFFLALGGMLIAPPKARALLFGMWAGYFVYGLFFPFQMPTHDYYHLMLIPILALSLASAAELILDRLGQQGLFWKAVAAAALAFCVVYPAWVGRSAIYVSGNNYRREPPIWAEIGQALPRDGDVIALTHDYGYRLAFYGWRMPRALWPTGADFDLAAARGASQPDFQAMFADRTEGKRYFLVTLGSELEKQAALKDMLYGRFTLIAEGDGYVIFDLMQPKESVQGTNP
jgi:4-amino-4-deoxy-L-arabinose transferase-like glycosyltransferase